MLIYCGKIQPRLIIIFIFPIFLQFSRIIRDNDISNGLFNVFKNNLGTAFCGIFYIIISINFRKKKKKKNKRNNSDCSSNTTQSESSSSVELTQKRNLNTMLQIEREIENQNIKAIKRQKQKQILPSLIISVCRLIGVCIKNLWDIDIYKDLKYNIQNLIELLFLVIFSVIFLKFTVYSHQIVSIIIIAICLLVFFINTVIYDHLGIIKILDEVIYYTAIQFFYCLSNVLGKIYLNKYFDNIYIFLLYVGLISLILVIIAGIVFLFVDLGEKFQIFQAFKKINIFYFFLDIFLSSLYQIGLWLTIYYFSPCHYIIFETIGNILDVTYTIIKDKNYFKKNEQIFFIALYPIILFIVLVFNEIIILNFCGLNYNTKIEIMKRERLDTIYKESFGYSPFLDDSDETSEEI